MARKFVLILYYSRFDQQLLGNSHRGTDQSRVHRMKQKIVITVSMACDKCRAKAMELAARTTGVISVAITGDYADRLEVVGDGVDLVCLVGCLRKKVGQAVVLQVEEVKAKKPEEKKPEEKKPPLPECYPGCYHCQPVPQMVICDEPGACSIM